jgi:hypothetical protein
LKIKTISGKTLMMRYKTGRTIIATFLKALDDIG